MEYHYECLLALCRVCGEKALNRNDISRKLFSKAPLCTKYATQIKDIYGIDISTDTQDVHPSRLCKGCANKMDNIKKSKSSHATIDGEFLIHCNELNIKWTNHSQADCFTCALNTMLGLKSGRKAKRKSGGRPAKCRDKAIDFIK